MESKASLYESIIENAFHNAENGVSKITTDDGNQDETFL